MRTRFQNLRSSTALVRPAPSSGLPGQFYVNMVDRIIGFFNDAGQPVDFAYLPLAGGSLSGFLTLHADPTTNLHASTKGYSDAQDAALNTALRAYTDAQVATRLPLAGGTLTGFLTLHADPTAAAHAANRNYVDTQVATRLTQAQADARFLQLSGGTLTNFLTLHANPTANGHASNKAYVDTQVTTRLTQAQADARFLQLSGGTLTGPLTLPQAPTADLQAATKRYVDDMVAGINFPPGTHVGDTPPTGPAQGQLWYKTVEPVGLFIWYVDADSSQWVQIGGGGAGGGGGGVPIGTVSFFAANSVPSGWLICDNQRVTTAYPDLRQYLLDAGSPYGTTGGDPRVPELRGEFIRGHIGARAGVDAGRVFGSAQDDAFETHVHGALGGGSIARVTPGGVGGTFGFAAGATGSASNSTASEGGTETRPRNVALLACIKAFSAMLVEGQANFGIATISEVRAGARNDVVLTPANVRALSGSQLVTAPIALAGHTFTGIPDEATEIELLFEFLGSNAAAAHYIDVTLNGLIAGYTLFRVALANSVAVAAGDLVTTAFRCEVFANGLGLAGNLRLVRGPSRWIAEGKWRSPPNYVSVAGASPSLGAVNSIKLTPSVALAIGSVACRWRI